MATSKLPHAHDYAKLGLALRRLRLGAELTQVEAGEAAGIRSKFVSEVERGNRGLRWHTLLLLLSAYGADLRDLADAIDLAA